MYKITPMLQRSTVLPYGTLWKYASRISGAAERRIRTSIKEQSCKMNYTYVARCAGTVVKVWRFLEPLGETKVSQLDLVTLLG